MRLAAFFGVVLATSLAIVGAAVLVAFTTPDPDPLWAGLATAAAGVFLYGAVLLGSLRAQWDLKGSAQSRRCSRRWFVAVVVGEIAASVLLLASAMVSGTPAWVVGLLIAVGVAATAVSVLVGARIRAREVWHPQSSEPTVHLATIVRRAALAPAITFAVTLVVVLVTLIVIELAFDGGLGGIGLTALVAVGVAFLAAAVAGIVIALPAQRRLRSIASGDLGRAQRFGRAIFRGKPEEIAAKEMPAAVEFAHVGLVVTRLQWAWMACLYLGLGLQQVANIVRRPDDAAIPTIVVVGLGVVAVALVPLVAAQQRRTRRFIDTHAGDVSSYVVEPHPAHDLG